MHHAIKLPRLLTAPSMLLITAGDNSDRHSQASSSLVKHTVDVLCHWLLQAPKRKKKKLKIEVEDSVHITFASWWSISMLEQLEGSSHNYILAE